MLPEAQKLVSELDPLINAALLIEALENLPLAFYQFPIYANYSCTFASNTLKDYLRQVRPDLEVLTMDVEGIDPELNTALVHPKGRGVHFAHTVLLVNRILYIDLTYRQWDLNSEFPFYADVPTMTKLWRSISPTTSVFQYWPIRLLEPGLVNSRILSTLELCKTLGPGGLIFEGYEKWHTHPLPDTFAPTLVNTIPYHLLWSIMDRSMLQTRAFIKQLNLTKEDIEHASLMMGKDLT